MWRICLDTVQSRLAIEVRDAEVLLAHFFSLDARIFNLLPIQLENTLTWWLGLEDAHDGLVFLHGYGDQQMGEHKGIRAFAVPANTMQWEQDTLRFYGVGEQGLLVQPADAATSFKVVNYRTGAETGEVISQQQVVDAIAGFHEERYKNCIFPMHYRQGEAYFTMVQEFLEAQLNIKATGAIEYAETEKFIISSYYEKDREDKLNNGLTVFDLRGNLYLHVTLGTRLKGIGTDTFFIFGKNLYFIQDRNSLVVHSLHF